MNLSRFRAGLLMTVLSGVVLASPVFDTHAQGGDTPKVGDIVVDGLGFEMVYVPAGTFEMGIQQETLEALVGPLDEGAVEGFTDIGVFEAYTVDMYYFWIDRYEVTIEQYTKYFPEIMDKVGIPSRPELMDTPQNPIVGVDWVEAVQFCGLREAHLPTEEEWEYAASGPENLLYPWGNTYEPDNVHESMADGTYPAGSKPGNVSWVGAYDMAGNVEEWVEDRFLPYSTSSPFPRDGSLDTARVARGGTYYHYEYALATFVRYGYGYYHGSLFTGFRCARLSDPRLD